MVVIALAVLLGVHGTGALMLIPVTAILFREVFVSGLREFLGDTAGTLKVTQLAKWKTTVQMFAIGFLFALGIFEHFVGMLTYGMDRQTVVGVLAGDIPDENGLLWYRSGMILSYYGGLALLWIAAALTLISGLDYFRKALPYLRET